MKSLKKKEIKKSLAQTPDIEKEKAELLVSMVQSIPEDLMKQIEYFSKLATQNVPQLHVWTSSHGTGNAN